ncbi:MAG: AMP-binding protein [Rhodobacteraceae bacterium]|nr:AMP-binding protein [Paracoccaceae bacterium]
MKWVPLAPNQKHFHTAWGLYPDRATDCSCLRLRWRTDVDVAIFRRALECLVASTDSFRLVFREIDGVPFQAVDDTIRADLHIADFALSGTPLADAVAWLDASRSRPVDLARRNFETCLARCGQGDWIWQVTQHHTACDHFSHGLLIERLDSIYRHILETGADPAPVYSSYVDFLARSGAGQRPAADPDAPLAADNDICPALGRRGRHRPVSGATAMVREAIRFGPRWIAEARAALGLPETGRQAVFQSRIFDHSVAAAAALTARFSGDARVVVGIPNHNRFTDGCENVAGLIMDVKPVAFDIGPDMIWRQLTEYVGEEARRILRSPREGRAIVQHPYRVTMNYLTTGFPDFAGVPSEMVHQDMVADSMGLDLGLRMQVSPGAEAVTLCADVNAEVAAMISPADILIAFRQCLTASLKRPETGVAQTALVDDAGRATLRQRTVAAHETPRPPHATVIDGILAQAARSPDADAIVEGATRLTYREVETQSACIARNLRRLGVGPGDRVAITLPRSADLILCMFGVWRAGAAYCVIDADWSAPRREAATRLLGARTAIYRSVRETFGLYDDLPRVALAELARENDDAHDELPPVDARSAAYVMFSSGSTGVPKAICVPHDGLALYMDWAHEIAGRDRPWDWALASTASFEIAHRPFLSLLSGGAIHVYPENRNTGVFALRQVLEDDRVDFLSLTPSHLRQLIHRNHACNRLSTLVVIGEKLSVKLARAAQAAFGPGVSIQNWYGPTETVMATTMHRFDPAADTGAAVPVGVPAPSSTVQICDPHGNPVPDGVQGEVLLGGSKMSLGYLGDPDLTRSVFTDDPDYPGGLRFRTGDIGWIDQRGNLTIWGRLGAQIKIKGGWVRLNEVEQVVADCPGIRHAAVVATGDDVPDVVCFYTTAGEDMPPRDLRRALRARLAGHEVPGLCVNLDSLPLTATGKLDRQALQAMADGGALARPEPRPDGAAADPVAEALTEIWRRALRTDEIGPNDDFFDLGGDSLSLLRMILEVESTHNLRITHEDFESVTTIARLARMVAQRAAEAPESAPEPARPAGVAPSPAPSVVAEPGPMDEIARRIMTAALQWGGTPKSDALPLLAFNAAGTRVPLFWCFNGEHEPRLLAQALGPDQPLIAMRSLNGVIADRDEKIARSADLAHVYADEIARLHPRGPLMLGGNCQAGLIAEHIARVLLGRGREVRQLSLLEHTPSHGYPARMVLMYGAQSKHYNPFLMMENPDRIWREMHRDVHWDIIDGDHGRYFDPENLPCFAGTLLNRLAQAAEAQAA